MGRPWVLKLSKEEKEDLIKSIIKLRVEERLSIKAIVERKQLSTSYVTKILKENNIDASKLKEI